MVRRGARVRGAGTDGRRGPGVGEADGERCSHLRGSVTRGDDHMPAQPATVPSVRDQVTAEEWQARVDLAAMYRLTALYHWDDLVFTHISMRVPDADHHFLINPFGHFFEEITASSLVKVDIDGTVVMETPYFIN